jgi:hypothetical protein
MGIRNMKVVSDPFGLVPTSRSPVYIIGRCVVGTSSPVALGECVTLGIFIDYLICNNTRKNTVNANN